MIEIKYITGYSPRQKSIYRYFLIPTRRICGDLCCFYFYGGIGERNIVRGRENIRLDLDYRKARTFKKLSIPGLLKTYKPILQPRLDNKSFDLSQGCKILKEELIQVSNKQFRQIAFPIIYTRPCTNDKAEIYLREQEYLQELLNNYPDEN